MTSNSKLPRATLKEKIEVLDYMKGPPLKSQIETLNHFKNLKRFAISQATLSTWTSNEKKLRLEFDENPNLESYKKIPVFKNPNITKQVENYISELVSNGENISDQLIKNVYTTFMIKNGYSKDDLKLSTGMLKSFKKRNTLINSDSLQSNSSSENPQSSVLFHESSSTNGNLDFNFEDIFNNNSIGFNTRLIHTSDPLFYNNQEDYVEPNCLAQTTFPDVNTDLNGIDNRTNFNSAFGNMNEQLIEQPNKRPLPYYPSYQNPLSDNQYYKRQKASFGSKISSSNSEKIERILENITNGNVTLYNSGTSAIMGILSYLNPRIIYIDDEGYKGTHDVIKFLNKLTNVQKLPLSNLNSINNKNTSQELSVIILESPMNPLGYIHDINYYATISNNLKNCKLIVDSTLAPPPLQFPFDYGADFIVYSAVKYLAGVSDLGAGFIVSLSTESKNDLHIERSALGTSIANFDSFLLVRNLRTYKMRILTQCNNTEKIINYLIKNFDKYNNVLMKIHHASLQSNNLIVMKQLNGFYNPVFALELKESEYPKILLNKFNYLSNNPNLEGGETLVELIYGNSNFNILMSQNNLNPYSKMLRFSIGCEDYQDIIKDIDQALLSLIKNLKKSNWAL